MEEQYLTLEQNVCAARVFLNTFGVTLEDKNDIDESSKIKIFDKDLNTVGKLCFDNGKVIISAKYNNYELEASYDIAKISGFIDKECKNAVFGEWASKIAFKIQNNNNIKIDGEFLISCSVDSEFGIKCLCHPLIKCEVPNKGNITIILLRDGRTFGLDIETEKFHEIIDIMPWDWLNGYIRHDKKTGEYDKEIKSYPYRLYAGIFNGAEVGENKDKLHVFLNENNGKDILAYSNGMIPRIAQDNSSEAVIQKGLLMKELDPKMYERITQLRELLLIGDISLLDNLFSVCYDSYSDEELDALLGIQRSKMNYQDGADNLVNSYFGIDKGSKFLSTEQQKLLLKKIKDK